MLLNRRVYQFNRIEIPNDFISLSNRDVIYLFVAVKLELVLNPKYATASSRQHTEAISGVIVEGVTASNSV